VCHQLLPTRYKNSRKISVLRSSIAAATVRSSPRPARIAARGSAIAGRGRELEARVKRVATGYEVELRIAVDDLVPMERLFPLLDEFYNSTCGTRLKLLTEVYGGAWMRWSADAPIWSSVRRVKARPAVATVHARLGWCSGHSCWHRRTPGGSTGTVATGGDVQHRSIAAADSSRNLPPRTTGLLSGQTCSRCRTCAARSAFNAPDSVWVICRCT